MKTMTEALLSILVALLVMMGGTSTTRAGIIWEVNPVSGDIVQINPSTGAILGSFAAPLKPEQDDTTIGLSIAEHGRTLLYQLGGIVPGGDPFQVRDILYRLDPYTGAIKSQEQGLRTSYGPDGISWESKDGNTYTFINHANPIPDIHRFENLGEPGANEIDFWGPTGPPDYNYSVGGLGGDGYGREFGVFLDKYDLFGGHRFIGEYDPFLDYYNSNFLNTFIAPADDIVGLAFDGQFLYAASASGPLFTLNPDTGAVIRSAMLPQLFYPDGSLAPYKFDIAAAPEPTTLTLLGIGVMGLALAKRKFIGTMEPL